MLGSATRIVMKRLAKVLVLPNLCQHSFLDERHSILFESGEDEFDNGEYVSITNVGDVGEGRGVWELGHVVNAKSHFMLLIYTRKSLWSVPWE
jgi:hypothetical protein